MDEKKGGKRSESSDRTLHRRASDSSSERLARALHRRIVREDFNLRRRSVEAIFSDDENNSSLVSSVTSSSSSVVTVPSNTVSSPQAVASYINLVNMANAYPTPEGPQLAYGRFCGRLEAKDKADIRLSSYTVERWLADTLARCTSKGITDDLAKIKEASLGINQTKGDAAVVMNSQGMQEFRTWSEFEKFALSIWKGEMVRDNLRVIPKLVDLSPSLSKSDLFKLIEAGLVAIKDDVECLGNDSLPCKKVSEWDRSECEPLVRLRDILTYMGVGLFISKLGKQQGDLFRKIKMNYQKSLLLIYSQWLQESDKRGLPEVMAVNEVTECVCFASKTKHQQGGGNTRGAQKDVNVKANAQNVDQGQGHNKHWEDRNRSANRNKCHFCGKEGHFKNTCRKRKNKCRKCNEYGHFPSECESVSKRKVDIKSVHVSENTSEEQA